jgi:hypothetical protein
MPNSGRSGACRRSTAAGVNSDGASSGENLTLGTGSEGGSRPKPDLQNRTIEAQAASFRNLMPWSKFKLSFAA